MCKLNMNFKILGEILGSHTRGSIIFHHVQAKSEFYNLGVILLGHVGVNHLSPCAG